MIQGLLIERSSSVSNLGLLKLTIIFASHLWYLIFFSILLLSVPCTRCRATIHWTKSHYNLCGAEQRATGRLQPLWCVHGAKEGSTGRKATTTSATSVVPSNDPLQQHHCPFFSPSMLRCDFLRRRTSKAILDTNAVQAAEGEHAAFQFLQILRFEQQI